MNDQETIRELSALMTVVMSMYKVGCGTGGRKMTEQEAIDYLHLLENNVLLGQKITEAVHMAIEALEKQIPKKPNYKEEDRFVKELFAVYTYCPVCEKEVSVNDMYCVCCGQKIDWEEGMR